MKHPYARTVLAASLFSLSSLPMPAAAADAETEARLKAMETRLNAVEAKNQSLRNQLTATDQKVSATTDKVDQVANSTTAPSAASWAENTRIGGYGELHYNNLDGEGGASDKNELDLHRFVLFFGHSFNENLRFFSELEVEHDVAGDGQVGEVEVEQAYVEYNFNANHRVKGGVFLIPVGILNENHEPPVFYGVERNPVEKDIVPATWWAGGAAFSGNLGAGFGYDFALHEGLATSASSGYKPRSGRQKTGEADASDLAYTARLNWSGLPGLVLSGTYQRQTDITQGADPAAGSANLYELHGAYNWGPFGLKALYAQWKLDGSGPAAIGADKQNGWYIEPAFRLDEHWGFFARYNAWDNKAGDDTDSALLQTDLGVNFWPHPDVVVKADYQWQDHDSGKNQDGFNLGVGYQF